MADVNEFPEMHKTWATWPFEYFTDTDMFKRSLLYSVEQMCEIGLMWASEPDIIRAYKPEGQEAVVIAMYEPIKHRLIKGVEPQPCALCKSGQECPEAIKQ